jgi:hypothetical protein
MDRGKTVSKKRKKNKIVVLAELWLTDKDGNPQKVTIKGHERSVKKRMKLVEIERQLNETVE